MRWKRLIPNGPKGEKRPAVVIGNAVKIARIATGEEEEASTGGRQENVAASHGNVVVRSV